MATEVGRRPPSHPVRGARARQRLLLIALVVTLALATGVGVSVAGSGNNVVQTLGDEKFIPNVQVQANLKYSPGDLRVASGDTLTIQHADKTSAPHTLTIVGAEEFPQTIEELFTGSTCPTCGAAGGAHFSTMPPTLLVDGGDGFNEVGDSVLFFQGDTVQVDVTASPGETLSFLCIIHPWMQGTINVT